MISRLPRVPLAPLLLVASQLVLWISPVTGEEFPGDPLRNYSQAVWYGTFMQYTATSCGIHNCLHSGIDVHAPTNTFVYPAIREGELYTVVEAVEDHVLIAAGTAGNYRRQGGQFVLMQVGHIFPTITRGTIFSDANRVIGQVLEVTEHTHLMIGLVDSPDLSDYASGKLVNPEDYAFSTAGWAIDDFTPVLESVVDPWCVAGQQLTFLVKAYDRNNSIGTPVYNTGIYMIELRINGEVVDAIQFWRFRGRDGISLPNWSDYYDGDPPMNAGNNPNQLVHKLYWTPTWCNPDDQWSIYVYDSGGNVLQPGSGPTVSPLAAFGGRIVGARVLLQWRMNGVRGIEHFNLLRSGALDDIGERVNPEPIEVREAAPGVLDFAWGISRR